VDDMWVFGPFLIPITAIVGSFIYIIIKTLAKTRVRELEIRERIAMIERGLVPPPEVDPRGFDRAMDRVERMREYRRGSGAGRHRRAGVTLMGVGFGLMVLIYFTSNESSVAIGVGGFLVVMGLAFFINSLMESPADPYVSSRNFGPSAPPSFGATTPPSPPSEPPRRDANS
jgi:uncharacterized protein DUF6249